MNGLITTGHKHKDYTKLVDNMNVFVARTLQNTHIKTVAKTVVHMYTFGIINKCRSPHSYRDQT